MEELPEWKQYHIEIHILSLYVSGNNYIVQTVYSVRISIQTEQRLAHLVPATVICATQVFPDPQWHLSSWIFCERQSDE